MANISGNARITDQIMDYYVRHGQNRDLERFLRLRAASTTRSSSDGSLPGLEELDRRERLAEKMGRSMENLSTIRKEEQELENSRSRERLDASGGSAKSDSKSPKKEEPVPEVVVKDVKSEKKSGRNFNFNLESVIEIKLPPALPQQPAILVSPKQAILASTPAPIIHEICSAGTQTMPEARSVEQQTEEPIRPILKPSALNPAEETIETTRDISPSSSVASAKQKLEWDSLGDIGYDSNEKFYFCGASDLNETEKRCLQKYFAKKGLNFDEKIVVVKNVPPKKNESEEPKEMTKEDTAKKWQNVYQKYKEKYPNPSEISLSLMNPYAQSTPKVVVTKEVTSRPVKSTQTSLVKILSKGIQAEQAIDTTSKQVGTSPQKSHSSTSNITPSVVEPITNTDQVDVADSFEFFSSPPSANESHSHGQVHQSSAGSTLKTTPEVTSTTTSSSSSHSLQQSGATGGEYSFDDELRLGMTLYNTIYESRSLPARVKQSLIDKIFRKMVKNDPRRRTKEQLLEYCGQLKRDDGEGNTIKDMSGIEEVVTSGSSSVETTGSKGKGETKTPVVQEVAQQEQQSEASVEKAKEDTIVQNFQELSIKSNEGRNLVTSLTSSQPTLSSSRPDSSKGTAKHRSQVSLPKSSLSDCDQSSDQRIRKAMTDYLRPMTRSEVDYANQQDLRQYRKPIGAPTTATTTSSNGDRIFALFQKEKQSQLLKVDKKIEHLKAIKILLLEEQEAVREIRGDTSTTVPAQEKFRKPLASPTTEEKENIYENTQRKTRSAASAPVYTSVHGDTPSENSKNETEYSTESESAWNSHYHLKKMIQNRSKLETPTSDESIATFIKTRKEKFIENYERHRKQLMLDDQQHLYTKPYSGRHSKQDQYSRLNEKYSIRKLAKPPIDRINIPSSDVFISSDSMSIPAANTLTNTTTHQYDIKSTRSYPECLGKAAGTQTTSSILRTKPIFESVPKTSTAVQVPSNAGCHCACDCPCRHRKQLSTSVAAPPKHTEIIDGTHHKQDKQQQTKPSSIAYVITFQGGTTKLRNVDSEKDQVYRTSSTDTSSSHPETTDSKTNDVQLLPLKEQFKRARPSTLSRLKERQKCVNELHKLRSERNKQRKKLLLLTSDDSLRRCDVKQRLPPPPLAQTRIFSSKAIRENTRRQVKNLPEVLRKKEIEKINNLKRKNLILRDKFNKNLQRKVLHGNVDLSNSVRVMQD